MKICEIDRIVFACKKYLIIKNYCNKYGYINLSVFLACFHHFGKPVKSSSDPIDTPWSLIVMIPFIVGTYAAILPIAKQKCVWTRYVCLFWLVLHIHHTVCENVWGLLRLRDSFWSKKVYSDWVTESMWRCCWFLSIFVWGIACALPPTCNFCFPLQSSEASFSKYQYLLFAVHFSTAELPRWPISASLGPIPHSAAYLQSQIKTYFGIVAGWVCCALRGRENKPCGVVVQE